METSATSTIPSKSPTEKMERHFLLITMTLVVVLGVPVAISLVSGPQKDDTFRGLRSGVGGATRDPASMKSPGDKSNKKNSDPDSANGAAAKPSSVSKSVGCDQNVDLGSIDVAHIRLKAAPCGAQSEITVANTTNGFTAETVPLKAGEITTDFMDLTEGDNHIEISRFDSAGLKTVQSINVRRAPSSEK
jgi:hypothetical protein